MIKKYLLLATVLLGVNALAQCPATPIVLSSQADVDNFSIDYPGCTDLIKSLTISGSDIINFCPLTGITSVDGSVLIINNDILTNLDGLETLTTVPIGAGLFAIESNPLLENILGLTGLTGRVGMSIQIQHNPTLVSLQGLENVTGPGDDDIVVINNDLLVNLDGLQGMTLADDVVINDNANLVDLTGFDNFEATGDIIIRNNASLTSLNGMPNLTMIYGLILTDNLLLADIEGIGNAVLEPTGFLEITGNTNLAVCGSPMLCNYLNTPPTEPVIINSNAPGCNTTIEILDSCVACPSVDLSFASQAEIDAFAISYPDCSFIDGSVTISGSDIVDLTGLSGISSIGGQLTIENNPLLTSLSSWDEVALLGVEASITILDNPVLEQLTSFFGVLNQGLQLLNNPMLSDITGFNGISSAGSIVLVNSDALTAVTGLENVAVDNELVIIGNDQLTDLSSFNSAIGPLEIFQLSANPAIVSLAGLEGLTMSSSGFMIINNNLNLSSFVGLSGITEAPFGITVSNNPNLLSMSGLSNMSGATTNIFIHDNDLLASTFGLQAINRAVRIEIFENQNMISLLGLEGIENTAAESPFELLIIENPNLNDISAINNYNTDNVNLVAIIDNTNLAFCNYQFICEVVVDSTVTFVAEGNDGECESIEAIQVACGLGIDEHLLTQLINVYPNPTSSLIQIELPAGVQLNHVRLIDPMGKTLINSKWNSIDISTLASGMYFMQIQTNQGTALKRLLKQ